MSVVFHSRFKKHISNFLRQKRALGYVYGSQERLLEKFDLFCLENFPKEKVLTKQLALKWSELCGCEGYKDKNCIIVVRQLAEYMNALGSPSYVIPYDLSPRKARYIPHIFTKDELSGIFSAFDKIPYCSRSPIRHLVIPVMFRMIYCCGLRPGEGRTILRDDVDLKNGRIVIRRSKGYKDRTVALSDDMQNLCRRYDTKIRVGYPDRRFFFPNSSGGCYTKVWMCLLFQEFLKKTNLKFCGNQPRTYDLRHTFATNVLFRWTREGKELSAHLPYLSAYLGHADFSSTTYYIHLVPQFHSQMSEMFLNNHSFLIPEIEIENEN